MYQEESDDLSYARAYVRDKMLEKVPPRFAGAETDNSAAIRWLAELTGTLYIFGPTGSGKTHIAWALYRSYAKRGIGTARFWSFADLLDGIRPGGDEETMNIAKKARVLIIDDIGAQMPSRWAIDKLLGLVDYRWAHMLPTIVTGNLRPRDLGGHVGDQVASRWAHNATTIGVIEKDRRRA
jgi:DNA replication protein DnaC